MVIRNRKRAPRQVFLTLDECLSRFLYSLIVGKHHTPKTRRTFCIFFHSSLQKVESIVCLGDPVLPDSRGKERGGDEVQIVLHSHSALRGRSLRHGHFGKSG